MKTSAVSTTEYVSCELVDFGEIHLCKLRRILRSHVLIWSSMFSPNGGEQIMTAVEPSEWQICGYGSTIISGVMVIVPRWMFFVSFVRHSPSHFQDNLVLIVNVASTEE